MSFGDTKDNQVDHKVFYATVSGEQADLTTVGELAFCASQGTPAKEGQSAAKVWVLGKAVALGYFQPQADGTLRPTVLTTAEATAAVSAVSLDWPVNAAFSTVFVPHLWDEGGNKIPITERLMARGAAIKAQIDRESTLCVLPYPPSSPFFFPFSSLGFCFVLLVVF